ncbi:MAG: choice-of-anchor Q domain-containing protein [Pseudomonadota bacterium]
MRCQQSYIDVCPLTEHTSPIPARLGFFFAALLLLVTVRATAVSILVTTTIDEISVNGQCSLREAVQAANSDLPVDVCAAGNGADLILLGSGTYTLEIVGREEDENLTGDLDLTASLTMVGTGQDQTIIDGGSLDRVINVDPGSIGVSVSIEGLTIRGGDAERNTGLREDFGGGIRNHGELTLRDVTLRNNIAFSGGAIENRGVLTLQRTVLVENIATWDGGGVFIAPGATTTIEDSRILRNSAVSSFGGGIGNQGTLALYRSELSDNNALAEGGGLFSDSMLQVESSLVASNGSDIGGGIFIQSGTSTLTNVTISGNESRILGNGGGLAASGTGTPNVTLLHVTITDNFPDGIFVDGSGVSSTVANTIIAGNQVADCVSIENSLMSEGHNLDSDGSCVTDGINGDLTRADPGLGPLASNEGPLSTHALVDGSPAIDSGNNDRCAASDQRGIERPLDGDGDGQISCDIGAFEVSRDLILADGFED